MSYLLKRTLNPNLNDPIFKNAFERVSTNTDITLRNSFAPWALLRSVSWSCFAAQFVAFSNLPKISLYTSVEVELSSGGSDPLEACLVSDGV